MPIAVSLVLTPLITASVTTLEYGSYVNYLTLVAVTNVFVGLSSAAYITNAYIRPDSASEIVSSMLFFMILTILPSAVIAASVAHFSDLPMSLVISALLVSGMCSYISSTFQSLAILKRFYGMLFLVALSQVVAQSSIVLGMIVLSRVSAQGLLLANVAGSVLACICALVLWQRIGLRLIRPRRDTVRAVLVYAIPLAPHMLLSLASGSFDRWYLVGRGHLDNLAVYSVAATVAGVVMIVLDMGNKVYSPGVFERLRSGQVNIESIMRKASVFLLLSFVSGLVVAAAGYLFVIHAFQEDYAASASLAVFLALACSTFSVYYAAAPFLYFFNKTGYVFASSLAGAVATVIASYALYGTFELNGLVMAKVVGFLVSGLSAIAFAMFLLKAHLKVAAAVPT